MDLCKDPIWIPIWILYGPLYGSHMDYDDLFEDHIWISVRILYGSLYGSYVDPIWIPLWILYPIWILKWILHGSLYESYSDLSREGPKLFNCRQIHASKVQRCINVVRFKPRRCKGVYLSSDSCIFILSMVISRVASLNL